MTSPSFLSESVISSAVLVSQDSGWPSNMIISPDLHCRSGSDRNASFSLMLNLRSPLMVIRPVFTRGLLSFSSMRALKKKSLISCFQAQLNSSQACWNSKEQLQECQVKYQVRVSDLFSFLHTSLCLWCI